MKIKRISAIALLLCIAVFVTALSVGCGKGSSEVGTYLNGKYPDDATELKKDATFLIKEGKRTVTGKYTIKDGRLSLMLADGSVSNCTISAKGITDSAGELWVKK